MQPTRPLILGIVCLLLTFYGQAQPTVTSASQPTFRPRPALNNARFAANDQEKAAPTLPPTAPKTPPNYNRTAPANDIVTSEEPAPAKPDPAKTKPVLLHPPSNTFVFGLTIKRKDDQEIALSEEIGAYGLTQGNILDVFIQADKKTVRVTGKREGTTAVILSTLNNNSVVLIINVVAKESQITDGNNRLNRIRDIMDKYAGTRASQDN